MNHEFYMGLEYSDDNDAFMTGDSEEGTYLWVGKNIHMSAGPSLWGWIWTCSDGKVLVTLSGHKSLSFKTL
jgi:hypothetical protein